MFGLTRAVAAPTPEPAVPSPASPTPPAQAVPAGAGAASPGAGPQAAGAPAAGQPGLSITLTQAVQMALHQNPNVIMAALNTAQSEEDRALARSALLPQLTAETSNRVSRSNLETFLGRTFPGFAQHAGPINVFSAGPVFSIPIFNLTLWRRYQAAREGVHATEAEQRGVREQMTLLVVSQYLAALRALADETAAESRLTLATALYRRAADLQRNGVSTGIDTLRANVQMQNERQRLITAQTTRRVALFGLARLLNLPPDQNVQLADAMSFFQTPAFNADQTLEAARANRPELQALAARERVAALTAQGAADSRLPTLNGGGNWAYQGTRVNNGIPTYVYQLTLDVPVFTGGRISAERARAMLERRKVDQQRQDVLNQITVEVKSAIAELEAARDEVNVATESVRLAEEEVTQARDRFEAGVANNIEVVTAQDELSRANDNQITALFRYNQARANLAHSTGQIERLYSKAP